MLPRGCVIAVAVVAVVVIGGGAVVVVLDSKVAAERCGDGGGGGGKRDGATARRVWLELDGRSPTLRYFDARGGALVGCVHLRRGPEPFYDTERRRRSFVVGLVGRLLSIVDRRSA